MKSRFAPLALFLLLAFFAGGIGALATTTSVHTWYAALHKPTWTPPDAVFGPVWTVLYVAMSVAVWRVWRHAPTAESARWVRLFGVQLALNVLWSVLFFGLRQPGAALVDVIVLALVLIRMLALFAKSDRTAAVLWTPYVLWVCFAAVLNAAVWELNR